MAAAVVSSLTGGCGHGTAPKRHAPDLAAFLRLPVATPSACAGRTSGSTAGRRSPWVGTVDVSVFVETSASASDVSALGTSLRALPQVQAVYFESAAQAYAEFQRLYTCSADVSPKQVPASYRLVLKTLTRPARDAVIAEIRGMPAVSGVSCDPSSPCLGK